MRAGFEPLAAYPGSHAKWRCRCKRCGKAVAIRLHDVRQGHGCAHCAGLAPMSLAKAKRLAKAANREIVGDFQNGGTFVLMRCLACGHEAKHRATMLPNVKGSCNHCKPTRRLSPDEAVELMRAAGLEPLVAYPGARKPWRSRCQTCKQIGQPQLANIRQGQSGCRTCSNYGYDVRKPTTLYVLVNHDHAAVKVGVTNTGSVRLRNLSRSGWRPGRLFHFREGLTPLHIETMVLRHLRVERGLKPAVNQRDMRGTRGATETFLVSDVSPRSIYAMIRSMCRGHRVQETR